VFKKKKISHWRQGILARSVLAVFVMALFVGGASSYFINQSLREREQSQAIRTLNEVLETVQSTASIAAFTNDQQLSGEVIQGLLRNSDILRVTITSGEAVLAQAGRPAAKVLAPENSILSETMAWINKIESGFLSLFESKLSAPTPIGESLSKPLASPFNKNEIIGKITLQADWPAIEARVKQNTRDTLYLLLAEMLVVVLSVAAVMVFLVIRPIKKISDRLHQIEPGLGSRISVPEGHEKTEIGRLVGDVNDLTGRLMALLEQEREMQRHQEVAQRKYQNLFDHAASGIFVADREGRLDSFNYAFSELIWRSKLGEQEHPSLFDAAWNRPDLIKSLLVLALQQETSGRIASDDFLLLGRRGDERWLSIAVTAPGDGKLQGTVTDVTTRKREEIQARQLASVDVLTGFFNRQGLIEAINQLISRSNAQPPFAVLVLNLVGFKYVNESMGLPAGDEILNVVAERIRAVVRPGDHPARIGGDEFVLLLDHPLPEEQFNLRLNHFFDLLLQPHTMSMSTGGSVVSLKASAGVAFFPKDGTTAHQLLRSAELALMSARHAGNQSYQFFDPQLLVAAEHRRRIEDDLKNAIGEGELYLGFQPIVDLASGKVVGAESLMRWAHPTRGMVPPDVFIPLAEEIGVIGEIGLLVLENACQVVSRWRAAGHQLYASVNVSALQIPNLLPPSVVLDALRRNGLPNDAIAIEITEGVLMGNVSAALDWMRELGDQGLRIYLDDFGTGYSSLSYLKRFPLNAVKIDKSFIRDLAEDSNDKALVNAIVTMAKSLTLDVIAEGVETEVHFKMLREMGCHLGQGFFFSPAVKAEAFASTVIDIEQRLAQIEVTG
jgi:diguanylate cyclase (GGDEF)-like protein/PAS domain S-box-containing protein